MLQSFKASYFISLSSTANFSFLGQNHQEDDDRAPVEAENLKIEDSETLDDLDPDGTNFENLVNEINIAVIQLNPSPPSSKLVNSNKEPSSEFVVTTNRPGRRPQHVPYVLTLKLAMVEVAHPQYL